MSNKFLGISLCTALTAAIAVTGTVTADAQSSKFTTAGAGRLSGKSAGEPTGPFKSPMPTVSKDVIDALANKAPNATMDGPAGTSGVTESDLDSPDAYGSSTATYTTARVAVSALGKSKKKQEVPVTSYPFRATGKIYARFGASWYICSGSMLRRGVMVTAAHCVQNFGDGVSGFADEVIFYPANLSGDTSNQPYGGYEAKDMVISSSYANGTDTCHPSSPGVVCNNDIALVMLKKRNKKWAGNKVGWYGYGWNGYSYTNNQFLNDMNVVQITSLGYPGAFDNGYQMQRTDSVGWYLKDGNLKNTQIGSAQTGGSSGGPWLANFGTEPDITGSASLGSDAASNTVIGVTSYGSTTVGYNYQGASYFGKNAEFPNNNYGGYGAGNIGALMEFVCTNYSKYC